MNLVSNVLIFELEGGHKLKIKYDQKNALNPELKQNIIGRLMKSTLKKLRLKPVGRKLFNIKKSESVRDFEIWPGYSTSLSATMNW